MTAYLTPERFRTMRHGANLTGLADIDLSEVLEDATAVVDSYCTVPYGHSFLGGSVIKEQLKWRYPETDLAIGSRRVYPKHWPIIAITGFRIVVGSSASASLSPNELVINQSLRTVEVTSASIVGSSGLFGVSGWIVPFGGLEQPIVEMDYTYGTAITETRDRLYPVGDSDILFQAPHGFLVEDDPVYLWIDDDGLATSDYEVDFDEGRVTFDAPPAGVPRLDYSHRLYREIPRATSIIAADLLVSAKLVAKGMSGIQRITAAEITIQRETPRQSLGAALDVTLPRAAELLSGFKYWSVA